MELQHQSKLQNLENQIVALKEKNRNLERRKQAEMNQLTQKLSSEIDKERNIATIMVEDLDEEKTRLIQEMDQLKKDYQRKLSQQKQQIDQLRQVAEDAVFYGTKAMKENNNKRNSITIPNPDDSDDDDDDDNEDEKEDEKDRIIAQLQMKLYDKEQIEQKYHKMKQSKKKLEQQVLQLSQQIIDTFSNNLSDDVVQKLNLKNG
eukprot:CAMPEP_0201593884 /NCGR_PEP_ID=MMETSP0190_2-20130828/191372_1 /ASSEMBLY_ACC=CAM_ASM_000263 /TAXON_ID=37353 /ORGANISM="Rosalina sp." /LENGTH=203 /DNA_ID=CAMNT_0048053285 /DNA_START=608 /DNA_END=1215 /DNA_ORIENTATION=-